MAASIAIVGAGPAGFYAAEALLATLPDVAIDLVERLPTPYGLIRAGVAPDHQSTKQVIRKLEPVGATQSVSFYGNVELGRDVALAELRAVYDAVVLAVGAPQDRRLGIPGEHLRGVYGASAFVGWYNGHPDFRDLDPLLGARVAVIGAGNVALDIARILVRSKAELCASDMPEHAVAAIEAAGVREVTVLGRRGPADAKFSPAELRETGGLADAAVVVDRECVARAAADRPAPTKMLSIFADLAERAVCEKPKRLHFRFFAVPVEVVGSERVRGLRVRAAAGGSQGEGAEETLACDAVIAAIGYRADPLSHDLPFDTERGVIASDDGRVAPGLYVVGWAKRGPTGVIASNRPDGARCAEQIGRDLASGGSGAGKPGRPVFERLLAERCVRVVTFAEWGALDRAEVARADASAPRRKFTRLSEMLEALDDPRTAPSS